MSVSLRFALRFVRPDPRGRVTDPVGDVVSFIQTFEEKYGRSHPVFYQGTYSQVSFTEDNFPAGKKPVLKEFLPGLTRNVLCVLKTGAE